MRSAGFSAGSIRSVPTQPVAKTLHPPLSSGSFEARRVTSVCFGRVDRTVYVTTEDNTTDAGLAGCLLVSGIDVAGAAPPVVTRACND